MQKSEKLEDTRLCVADLDNSVAMDKNGSLLLQIQGQHWNTKSDFYPSIEIFEGESTKTYMLSEATNIRQEKYQTGYSCGIRNFYEGFPFDSKFSFVSFIEIVKMTGQVKVGIIPLNDNIDYLKRISWPGPMDFHEIRADYYTVYPLQQGILIPNGWDKPIRLQDRWELDAEYLYSRSGYMPWFGQIRKEEGYWYLVNTPFDAGFILEHQAGGECHVGTVWHSQLGRIGYKREATYTFRGHCDYNTFAKDFRKYLKETGELCTLKEKMIKNPSVKALIGSSVFHDCVYKHIQPESFYYDEIHPEKNEWVVPFGKMSERIRKMKDLGIKKMFVHIDGWTRAGYDNEHPDPFPPCERAGGWSGFGRLCQDVKEMGYQFAIHDQYRDFFLKAPSYDQAYARQEMNGDFPKCSIWDGGEQEFMCPEYHFGYVQRNFTILKEHGVFLDGAYLDVFSCVPLDECYGELHRVTREQCMKERKKCLDYVRAQGMIISSEEGVGWAMRDLDLIHHAPYAHEAVEDKSRICGRMLPDSIGIPVPLLNLVYHDCIVIPWIFSEAPNGQSGFLHAMLNGGITYVSSDFSDAQIELVKKVAAWHEIVGESEMLKHEFLSDDRMLQRAVYANGKEIIVDFQRGSYEMRENSNLEGEE